MSIVDSADLPSTELGFLQVPAFGSVVVRQGEFALIAGSQTCQYDSTCHLRLAQHGLSTHTAGISWPTFLRSPFGSCQHK